MITKEMKRIAQETRSECSFSRSNQPVKYRVQRSLLKFGRDVRCGKRQE
jgi:hypothetical protein